MSVRPTIGPGRLLLAAAALLALIAGWTAAAAAQTTVVAGGIERAAQALPRDNVYVDPDAERGLSGPDAARLRREIAAGRSGAVYVAVLPEDAVEEAGGDIGALAREIGHRVRRPGTYVVVAGERIGAASTVLPPGAAGQLAREAAEAGRGTAPAVVLLDFVRRLGEARTGPRSPGRGRDGGGQGDGGGLGLLAALAALGGGLLALRGWRRRRDERARLAEVKEFARDDLVALGDDIRAFEIDMDMPDADPAAREDYAVAVDRYDRAAQRLERARRVEDLEQVSSALEEGRYAMTSAKARVEGRDPPERRPPCFFDPRHGPSVRDVEWAPPGGVPRPVPACAADAQRVEEGLEPASREVLVGGEPMPYWNAPAYYGPWAGGFFGGGLLPGLLMGSMLGSSLGWAAYPESAWGEPGVGDFGGGDFGDFGGGDFGGGGFGGGDFGGGGF